MQSKCKSESKSFSLNIERKCKPQSDPQPDPKQQIGQRSMIRYYPDPIGLEFQTQRVLKFQSTIKREQRCCQNKGVRCQWCCSMSMSALSDLNDYNYKSKHRGCLLSLPQSFLLAPICVEVKTGVQLLLGKLSLNQNRSHKATCVQCLMFFQSNITRLTCSFNQKSCQSAKKRKINTFFEGFHYSGSNLQHNLNENCVTFLEASDLTRQRDRVLHCDSDLLLCSFIRIKSASNTLESD